VGKKIENYRRHRRKAVGREGRGRPSWKKEQKRVKEEEEEEEKIAERKGRGEREIKRYYIYSIQFIRPISALA